MFLSCNNGIGLVPVAMDHALLRRINLNQLVTFLVVANQGSFRGAAAVLNISQPALSVQIRQLEEALETTLFRRTSRAVVVTEEGSRLLPVAQMLVSQIETVTQALRQESYQKRHIIRLVALPFVANLLTPIIEQFSHTHQKLEVRLTIEESSEAGASRISKGDADFGILFSKSGHDDLEFRELWRDEIMALVPASIPEFVNRSSISLQELSGYPILLQPPGSIVREELEAKLLERDLAIDVAHELRPADGLVALVCAGLGIAIMPKGTCHFLNLEGCRMLHLSGMTPRPFGLVLPLSRPAAAPVAELRDFVAELLRAPINAAALRRREA